MIEPALYPSKTCPSSEEEDDDDDDLDSEGFFWGFRFKKSRRRVLSKIQKSEGKKGQRGTERQKNFLVRDSNPGLVRERHIS